MKNIIINYGDLVNELKVKNVRILGQKLHKAWGQFIIDRQGNIYKMIEEASCSRSYMDKLIENKVVAEFEKINSNIIPEWNRNVYDLEKVDEFVKVLDVEEYKRKLLEENKVR